MSFNIYDVQVLDERQATQQASYQTLLPHHKLEREEPKSRLPLLADREQDTKQPCSACRRASRDKEMHQCDACIQI